MGKEEVEEKEKEEVMRKCFFCLRSVATSSTVSS